MRNHLVLSCVILLAACSSSEPNKFVSTARSLESGSNAVLILSSAGNAPAR